MIVRVAVRKEYKAMQLKKLGAEIALVPDVNDTIQYFYYIFF